MIRIAPSILAADFLRLGEQMREAEEGGADRFHVDVMDGRFVPNISLGVPVVAAIRLGTKLALEAHLMIDHPEQYLAPFVEAGADTIIVHQENGPHLHRTVQEIHRLGAKAGVAVNPATPVESVVEVLDLIDLLLVMTVNPGFGGQRFLPEVLPKIRSAAAMIASRNTACELEVDGGVDVSTAPVCVAAGASVLVAGTSIFRSPGGVASGVKDLLAAVEPG